MGGFSSFFSSFGGLPVVKHGASPAKVSWTSRTEAGGNDERGTDSLRTADYWLFKNLAFPAFWLVILWLVVWNMNFMFPLSWECNNSNWL